MRKKKGIEKESEVEVEGVGYGKRDGQRKLGREKN